MQQRTARLICEKDTLNVFTTAGSFGACSSGTSDFPSFASIGASPAASSRVGNTSISDAKPRVEDPFVVCCGSATIRGTLVASSKLVTLPHCPCSPFVLYNIVYMRVL